MFGKLQAAAAAASSYASQATTTLNQVKSAALTATSQVTGTQFVKPPDATAAAPTTSAAAANKANPAETKDKKEEGGAPAAEGGKKKGDKKEEEAEYFGRLEFKLDYIFDKSQLNVTVIQCENLPAMDMGGTSDPYVKVYILPDKKKKFNTKTIKKTLNPVYNETFIFPKIPFSDIATKELVFDIYDYDQFGANDQIGEVHVPLCSVDLGEVLQVWRDIKPPPKDTLGDICFSLRYVPQKSQLTVVVMECKNLKKMDITGGSDPYVKLNLMLNGKRIKKCKTAIKMNNLNPYYNQSFKFEVKPSQIDVVQLDIFVMDYDRVGSNDAIGHVLLGRKVGGTPMRHWLEMINNPRRSIAQWHTLQPTEEEEEDKDKDKKKEGDKKK